MKDICHYTFVQTHRRYNPRVNLIVNYRLRVIIMHQCRLINCNKRTTLVSDVDNGGGYVSVREGGIWEISVSSSQFCGKSKTSIKNFKKFKETQNC